MNSKVASTHRLDVADRLRDELTRGLKQTQKVIDPKYFYDQRGSQLFERITELPEYYLNRTERKILADNCDAIAGELGQGCLLLEPGAGACSKVRLLLNALHPVAYVPMDISAEFLQRAAAELAQDFPWLRVHPMAVDHSLRFSLPRSLPDATRVVFYPGSTIGNLTPGHACTFLRTMRQLTGDKGAMLIGVDLQKHRGVLTAAYNDSAGITAAFNRNILRHVNHLLNANFDAEQFLHHAFYNEQEHRIEMHLVSRRVQTVRFRGGEISFQRGESIHTENSYKYTLESFAALATDAGWQQRQSWCDQENLFSVQYLRAV